MQVALSSFFLTLFLIVLLSGIFRKIGWMDKPHLYGYKRKPVPYGMGIVFFMVFMVLSLLSLELSSKLMGLLIAGGLLTVTSFLDDRFSLPPVLRLAIQICCASLVILSGVGVPALTNPFGSPLVLDAIQWHFSVASFTLNVEPLADSVALIWLVFVINAMNWLDGSPGIVSGISTISCAVLYLLATMSNLHVIDQGELSTMSLIIGSSAFAFLLFDFPKPKILMGDSGTMFLGLMIAVMAIYSGGKLATAFIVLAFPILDAVWTIARRLLKRQSPFKGDFQHFHHELMRAGLSQRQVDVFYFSVSLGFGFAALYLQSLGKFVAILALFALMTLLRLQLGKKTQTEA